jgi:hypothetical protein
MSKLIIQTQVMENYAWREDGSLGVGADAYWKFKGGSDYVVKDVSESDMIDVIIDRVRSQIETDNDAFREYIVSWDIVADDYLTEFEKDQLEYEGRITYPAKELEATV